MSLFNREQKKRWGISPVKDNTVDIMKLFSVIKKAIIWEFRLDG